MPEFSMHCPDASITSVLQSVPEHRDIRTVPEAVSVYSNTGKPFPSRQALRPFTGVSEIKYSRGKRPSNYTLEWDLIGVNWVQVFKRSRFFENRIENDYREWAA